MMIVALTGGIGSGKSEATKLFASLEVPVVDLDSISHALTADNQPLVYEIAKAFGQTLVSKAGVLDRAALREQVFNTPAQLAKLNAILHPAIYQAALAQIKTLEHQQPYLILSIPLLTADSHYLTHTDRVLVIDCEETQQISRVMARNKMSEDEIKRIIDAQPTRKQRLQLADDIILNNGDLNLLRENVMAMHQKYLKACIVSKTIS